MKKRSIFHKVRKTGISIEKMGLFSKALKEIPNSPRQLRIRKEIDKLGK